MTSVLGGLRNAGTGLHSGQVVYMPGCTTTNCSESDFGAETTAAKAAKLTVLVLGTLGWCDAHTARSSRESVTVPPDFSLSMRMQSTRADEAERCALCVCAFL